MANKDQVPDPTEQEILKRAAEVRARWTGEEHWRRLGQPSNDVTAPMIRVRDIDHD